MTKLNALLGAALAVHAIVAAGTAATAQEAAVTQTIQGAASWYGPGFHGRRTANGETFDMNALTAAHPSLPFGTQARVTNEANGESVVVRINDRGPYAGGRAIDLSREAAEDIGLIQAGVGQVTIEVLGRA